MDAFSFTRQTAVFLAVLGTVELIVVLVFPMLALVLATLALILLVVVWLKTGLRARKWLWWNPAAVPLTQAEGALTVSGALLLGVGVLVTGYEAVAFTMGSRTLLSGVAWQLVRPPHETPRPLGLGMSGSHYSDPDRQQSLKDALTRAGIPYTLDTQDGKEFVHWPPEHDKAVEQIQRSVRGEPAPGKHSIAFENAATHEEFKLWLVERRIPFEVVETPDKKKYVAWKDAPRDLAIQFLKEKAAADCAGQAARPAENTKRC
jgi:hypothetical protein